MTDWLEHLRLALVQLPTTGDIKMGVCECANGCTRCKETNMSDHPFYDVAKTARRQVELGNIVHQKFTCDKCGVRQTIDEPNKFYTHGQCEKCGHITNIVVKGCNYLLITKATNQI